MPHLKSCMKYAFRFLIINLLSLNSRTDAQSSKTYKEVKVENMKLSAALAKGQKKVVDIIM